MDAGARCMLEPLYALGMIIVVGVGAQWLAWRVRLPSILLLLLAGIAIGPISSLLTPSGEPALDPDALFGNVLMPFVSFAVGLILYEGGLTLDLREIRNVRRVVTSLVTVGALVTWMLATLLAVFVLSLPWSLATLLGAILVVTGPTVIGPLLSHVRPRGSVGAILKWEGIVIDPIGASLAVLVFEGIAITIEVGDAASTAAEVAAGLAKTIVAGTFFGLLGALVLRECIKRFWAPDHLQNPISLLLVVAAFAGSNAVQHESGLLAVTLMGVLLANQRQADVKHIIDFKENLRVLLLSTLFIILGARLELEMLTSIRLGELAFVALLIVLVRPASILLATCRSDITWTDRAFMSAMAPRGIVAAAVASVFALRLEQLEGFAHAQDAERLVPITFAVIIGTVAFYGFAAPIVAKRLSVSDQNPQGVLLVGAQRWVRELAMVLHKRGVRVLLVDANRQNINEARLAGLPTYYGNVLADYALRELDLTGIGRVLAVTPNEEVNTLVAQRFERILDRSAIYQLPTGSEPAPKGSQGSAPAQGEQRRTLFSPEATFANLASRLGQGHVIKATRLTPEFNYKAYKTLYGTAALPMFILSEQGRISIIAAGAEIDPQPGQTIIALVDPESLFMR